ncbi:MAG: hypothetical protein U1E21_24195 [Reyranellaceae bacterium]
MNKILLTACALATAAPVSQAWAWGHAGAWSGGRGSWSFSDGRGGSASGGGGSWTADGYRGGTASGGDGSWNATGYRGGTASGGDGSWNATSASGQHYYGGSDYWHGGYYHAYNAPAVVNSYSANCYNCGGWNNGGAVAAGVLAGAAAATVGTLYGTLPAGCTYQPIGSTPYYSCANGSWLSPSYGANGVYYRVVPMP